MCGFAGYLLLNDFQQPGLMASSEIVRRPKQTYQVPIANWNAGAFEPWITGQMNGATGVELTDAHRQPHAPQHAYRMWSLAIFDGWRRAFALEY